MEKPERRETGPRERACPRILRSKQLRRGAASAAGDSLSLAASPWAYLVYTARLPGPGSPGVRGPRCSRTWSTAETLSHPLRIITTVKMETNDAFWSP